METQKQNYITISIIIIFVLVIGIFAFFYYKNLQKLKLETQKEASEEQTSLGAELFDKTGSPAEEIPKTNPFEAKTNPFSDYKNPFE